MRSLPVLLTVLLMVCCLPQPTISGAPDMARAETGADAARAPPRPDHDGQYAPASYMYEHFKASGKSYSLKMKIWYPANTSGENKTPDSSDAPYPLILMLPMMGQTEEMWNSVGQRIVSWGFVLVTMGQNWNNDVDCLNVSVVNQILDALEADNGTFGHNLQGMVDKERFGISGGSAGGAWSLIDGGLVPRIKAVQALVPAIGAGTTDQIAPLFRKPLQIQIGELDATYRSMGAYAYGALPVPKALLDVKGGQHGGPFAWDSHISFFIRYLYGNTTYEHYLYEGGAMDDAANVVYFLNYSLPNGTFFPASISISANDTSVDELEMVGFSAATDGFLPLGHPRGNFWWDFDSDGAADEGGPYCTSASWSFKRSGAPTSRLWYELGNLKIHANTTVTVTVRNLAPTVDAGGDIFGNESELLNFSAAGSDTSNDISGLQYSWSFGDGNSTQFNADPRASHSYDRQGNFTVAVTARDGDGATATDSLKVGVANLPPSATAGPALSAAEDEEVAFSGQGADTPADSRSLLYMWEFGDGGRRDWEAAASALHAYKSSGNYTAVLTVKDNDGATASSRQNVTVANQPPSSTIKALAQGTLDKDADVDFDGSGSDTPSDMPSLSFQWAFGDGCQTEWKQDAKAGHSYAKGGKYTAVLRVRDNDGATAEARIALTINNAAPGVAVTSPQPGEFKEDQDVRFSATGEDTPSDRDLLNYTWLIDEREYFGAVVDVAFTTAGSKGYTVTVKDPEGASAQASGSIAVVNVKPKLSADASPLALLVNDSLNFTAEAEDTASDMDAIDYMWDFGDGVTSTQNSGTHAYSRAGTFTVKVTASDDDNAKVTRTFTVRVDARPLPPAPPPREDGPAPAGPPIGLIGGGVACAAVASVLIILLQKRKKKGNIVG